MAYTKELNRHYPEEAKENHRVELGTLQIQVRHITLWAHFFMWRNITWYLMEQQMILSLFSNTVSTAGVIWPQMWWKDDHG